MGKDQASRAATLRPFDPKAEADDQRRRSEAYCGCPEKEMRGDQESGYAETCRSEEGRYRERLTKATPADWETPPIMPHLAGHAIHLYSDRVQTARFRSPLSHLGFFFGRFAPILRLRS